MEVVFGIDGRRGRVSWDMVVIGCVDRQDIIYFVNGKVVIVVCVVRAFKSAIQIVRSVWKKF